MSPLEHDNQGLDRNPEGEIAVTGRILWLTKDVSLNKGQINGQNIALSDLSLLLDNVSTDEIIPSQWCMSYSDPENLAQYLFSGVEGINLGDIKGKFQVIVVGKSFGRGSSREHAQLALLGAGVNLVIAGSLERIFKENCHNYGIHTLDYDQEQAKRLLLGETLTLNEVVEAEDPITQEIIKAGGLLTFTKIRQERGFKFPELNTQSRPMAIAEKIFAKKAKIEPEHSVTAVKPGDSLFVHIDTAYAYELQSVISQHVLEQTFGSKVVVDPSNIFLFEDHLALMESEDPVTVRHRDLQRQFAQDYNLKLYKVERDGVEGICHTVMLEKHILPGDLVLGNDSHTCEGGAANALAIGKGASEFAAALITHDIPIKVPETIRFNLTGQFNPGITSKDLMLYILSLPKFKYDLVGSGRIWEFGGEALEVMPFDDQVVLTNMTIEGQGFTGIIEPNQQLIDYLRQQHDLGGKEIEDRLVYPDKGAQYALEVNLDLAKIKRMVSLPGDTQNGIELSNLGDVAVNFAYIGSCTGGKLKDLREAAGILRGKKVNHNVRMIIQASSKSVFKRAEQEGLIEAFKQAGAEIIFSGCGDCMGATKDAFEKEEVVISDTNRNFRKRMGKSRTVYLASPAVVAASAIAGRIIAPEDLRKNSVVIKR